MIKKVFVNELNKLVEKIQSNYGEKIDYIGTTTNLKLHDANYLCETEQDYSNFNIFCEQEYQYFEEIEKENETVRDYIGRTSSFYIKPKCDYSLFRTFSHYEYDKKNILGKIIMLIEEYFEYEYSIDLSIEASYDYEIISINSEYAKELLKGLTINTREFFNTLYEEMEKNILQEVDCIYKTYEFLEDYKENQIEYFKEYLQNIKDEEAWEQELEEKRIEQEKKWEKEGWQELLQQVIDKINNGDKTEKYLIQSYLLNNATKKVLSEVMEKF